MCSSDLKEIFVAVGSFFFAYQVVLPIVWYSYHRIINSDKLLFEIHPNKTPDKLVSRKFNILWSIGIIDKKIELLESLPDSKFSYKRMNLSGDVITESLLDFYADGLVNFNKRCLIIGHGDSTNHLVIKLGEQKYYLNIDKGFSVFGIEPNHSKEDELFFYGRQEKNGTFFPRIMKIKIGNKNLLIKKIQSLIYGTATFML